MQRKTILLFLSLLSFAACSSPEISGDALLISHVDPFIGTGGHGHTYPGAALPFGMMQLGPDTRLEGWDGCSGYHYSDEYIYGFSHTHLSGTGISDYGDVLLMPANEAIFNNGADGEKGYRAAFSHDNETAEPGYYKVALEGIDVMAELTVAARSGMHRYTYPDAESQYLILDLQHRDILLDYKLEGVDEQTLEGYRHSQAWAADQRLFFSMTFSLPIKDISYDEDQKKAAILFDNPDNEALIVRVGISAVDEDGARKNREAEVDLLSFDELKTQARETWEKQLQKIEVKSDKADHLTNFYTALYHSMLAPNLYQDVDGRYRGMDMQIHRTEAFDYYTVFSLWDTYRAAHPLYTLIEQERTNDFIQTFLAKYDEGGIMPIWDLAANYTHCMIGYHAVPVIADAWMKGIRGYDGEKALEAMKHSAMQDKLGLKYYKSMGYIPMDMESESVSKTLEYAFDDWSIAQMAKDMGKVDDYETYLRRAQSFKNVYDPASGFMRGRFRNTWFAPFDPYEVNFNYTEANAWQYSNYVPQDISGLMQLHGGSEAFEAKLDELFAASEQTSGRDQADITGLIGQYAHGNEPSHHMAYLYNFTGSPHKTQELVDRISNTLYRATPDGISGNEDCGQMSAWLVFSAMGFYPVTPGSNTYIIGTPLMQEVSIKLESGKTFNVVAHDRNERNKYIARAVLNGQPLERTWLAHEEVAKGGKLEFFMTDRPSDWGTGAAGLPKTEIVEHLIVPAPFIASGDIAFKEVTTIELGCADPGAEIYYRMGAGEFQNYTGPFEIRASVDLEVYAARAGEESARLSTAFFKIDPLVSIQLESTYANQYNAGGDNALIDGILGAEDFRTGTWQGYFDEDLLAIVDLGREKSIREVSVNFLQDQSNWIFLPTTVECWVSADGKNFRSLGRQFLDSTSPTPGAAIENVVFAEQAANIRYVRIKAETLGTFPEWHFSYADGGRSWIFADEIMIN